jgi:hypothetical protein
MRKWILGAIGALLLVGTGGAEAQNITNRNPTSPFVLDQRTNPNVICIPRDNSSGLCNGNAAPNVFATWDGTTLNFGLGVAQNALILAEQTRAMAAEGTLGTNLTNEINRATAAEALAFPAASAGTAASRNVGTVLGTVADGSVDPIARSAVQPGASVDTNTVTGPGGLARAASSREADRVGPSIKEFGSETTCSGTGDDTAAFNNAAAFYGPKGGAFVYVAPGAACNISATFVNSWNNLVFGNLAGGATGHDVGGSGVGNANWTMRWTGAAGGTIARVAPATGATKQALTGSGFMGAGFICNSSAGIGLQIQSVRNGKFESLYEQECTVSGYDVGTVNFLGEAPDTQGNLFKDWNGRQISNAAPILTLRGAQLVDGNGNLTGGIANPSMDTFMELRGQHKNGPGLLCLDADNVLFLRSTFYLVSGGTGYAADLSSSVTGSCRDNQFMGFSGTGGILARGGSTATVGGTITAGDVVSLTFTGTALSTSPQTVSRTVVGGDTISTIGTALVTAINGNGVLSAAGITATLNTQAFIVPIYFAGQKGQTVTVTSSVTGGGTTTETATISPADGGMVGSPTGQNQVFGPDATNNDPLPLVTPGAQLFNIRTTGQVGGLAATAPAFAENNTNALVAQKLAANNNGLSGVFFNSNNGGPMWASPTSRCILAMSNSGSMRINRASNCPTFDLSGLGLQIAPRVVTASPVTMTSSDTVLVVRKTTGSATAITLPTPNGAGQVITIKDGKGDAATNPITVTPSSGTIDGAANVAINTAYGVVRLFYDGTTWTVL